MKHQQVAHTIRRILASHLHKPSADLVTVVFVQMNLCVRDYLGAFRPYSVHSQAMMWCLRCMLFARLDAALVKLVPAYIWTLLGVTH